MLNEVFGIDNLGTDFFVSWATSNLLFALFYIHKARHRTLISLEVFFVTLFLFVPIGFFSVFAAADINDVATGSNQFRLAAYVGKAQLISSVGVVAFFFCYYLFRKTSIRSSTYELCRESFTHFWLSRSTNVVAAAILLGFMFILMLTGAGFGKGRDFALEHRNLLFLFNFYNQIAGFLLFNSVIYAKLRPGLLSKIFVVVFLVCSLFFGTRSSSVATLAVATFCVLAAGRSKKIGRIAIFGIGIIVAGIVIGLVRRAGESTVSLAVVGLQIFYGNTFSDVRDFAWLLSSWNGAYQFGSTYLAGMLSLVPASAFPARSEFGWANFSSLLSGLDREVHPGLRPGAFGELFFNFGLVGVVLGGSFAGLVVGSLARKAQQAAVTAPGSADALISAYACFFLVGFVTYIFFSAGFFGLYVKAALIILGILISRAMRSYRTPIQ